MAARNIPWHVKEPADEVGFVFDLSGVVSQITAAKVQVQWLSGSPDPDPGAILRGASMLRGTLVQQFVTGGVNGAAYLLTCEARATSGEVYTDKARLLVMRHD